MKLPEKGIMAGDVLAELERYRENDVQWRDGRTWGYVYHPGAEAEEVGKRAYAAYLSDNALDPTAFPSLLRFENEVLAMAIEHLGGGPDAAGSFTSGGTESIMLAVKTARDSARAARPAIAAAGRPQVVLPVTAHAAFQKACHYLELEPVLVPVDTKTFRADPSAIEAAITDRTILLVASAPGYAHGVIDPIADIAKIAQARGLLFHVDACVGGFMLPYFRRLGADVPEFNLRVPGVTSVSMDLHKYAYCPKGASVVVYSDRKLREHQIYACASWTGYTIVNPTVQSTKSGGPVAAAWATLRYIGDEGYLELARTKLDATRRVIAGVEAIDGLYVLGEPDMNLVAIASDEVSVFHVADEMKVRGWYVQPQLAYGGSKENIHLSVNPINARWVDALLADLAECVQVARGMKSGELGPMAAQMLSSIGPEGLDDETFGGLLQMIGMGGGGLPSRMAEINEILNALPSAMREQLLDKFVNDLFRFRSGG